MHAPSIIAAVSVMAVLAIAGLPGMVSAESTPGTVTSVPLNEEISLEKTVIPMNIPLDNTHPWGAVTGGPSDYVDGYAIVIQFYQDGELVHTAQVAPSDDGSYEYQFRVRNLDSLTGEYVNLFSGDYTVHIFKVVPNASLTA